MIFGGVLAALGAAVTNSARPSTGSFNPWTYPAMILGYIGLFLAVAGIVGLVRGWEFPFAKKVQRAPTISPSAKPPNLSVLDPLTPLETPVVVPHQDLSGYVVTYDGEIVPRPKSEAPIQPSPVLDYPVIPEDPRSDLQQALDAARGKKYVPPTKRDPGAPSA
jgi:hypothetical protein